MRVSTIAVFFSNITCSDIKYPGEDMFMRLLQVILNIPNTYLSDKEHGGVVMLWVPLTRRIKVLLPRAEVPQSHAAIAGDLWTDLLILNHQHLHYDQIHRVFYAGVLVKLGYD